MLQGANEQENPPRFSLTGQVQDRTVYKSLSRMPSEDTLQELDKLSPIIASTIRHCLENIYAHVVQRDGDSLKVFFHAVASTVYYETYSQTLINDKDHSKKAAGIVHTIQKTLEAIEDKLRHPLTGVNQKPILESFKYMLVVHRNALISALKNISAAEKEHILKHQNLDIDNLPVVFLSPTKEKIVETRYPATPSPDKGKTPTKLTEADRRSISRLQGPKAQKKLEFSSEDSSSEESSSPRSASDQSEGSSSHSDDDDLYDMLTTQMNSRLIFSPLVTAAKPQATSSNAKKSSFKKK